MNIFAQKFDRELKSGIYINNNLTNKCQEDQYLIWKCHDFMIKIRHVFQPFLSKNKSPLGLRSLITPVTTWCIGFYLEKIPSIAYRNNLQILNFAKDWQ